MRRNTPSREKKSSFEIKTDKYGNLKIEIINEQDESSKAVDENGSANKSIASPEIKALMDGLFFAHFVVKKSDLTKKLSLRGNEAFLRRGKRLGDDDVPNLLTFLRDNPGIVELDLAHNEIQCDGFIEIIDFVTAHEEIVELDLRGNEIRSRGVDHLCQLADHLKLTALNLSGNKFGVEGSKQMALMLLGNRVLEELNVARVDQTASSLVYFINVLRDDQDSYNDTLKTLNISSPNPECMYYFDSAHFGCLIGAMLKNNNCLERLNCRHFGFSCHDIELMLAEGRYNETLLFLDLSANNIGDLGAEIIAEWLARRPALRGLEMAHNIVTNYGAICLSNGLPFSRIKYLDVSCNRIEDSGITEILNTIKKSPRVRSLKIFGNRIDHNSAKIIHRMLLSGVFVQENLDVKPYKIGEEWKCARYLADNCENAYI